MLPFDGSDFYYFVMGLCLLSLLCIICFLLLFLKLMQIYEFPPSRSAQTSPLTLTTGILGDALSSKFLVESL